MNERGKIVKVSEVMSTIKPEGSSDAEAEALKRQADDLRKRKQALKVSKARERLAKAQQAQSQLLNKSL
jgi:hypothetical protein